jgi:hypothetical protein
VNRSEDPLAKKSQLRGGRSSLIVQPARSALLLGALIFLILALVLIALMIKPALSPSGNFPQPKLKTPVWKVRRFPGSWPACITPMPQLRLAQFQETQLQINPRRRRQSADLLFPATGYFAIPTSYGTRLDVSVSSVWPTMEISGTV